MSYLTDDESVTSILQVYAQNTVKTLWRMSFQMIGVAGVMWKNHEVRLCTELRLKYPGFISISDSRTDLNISSLHRFVVACGIVWVITNAWAIHEGSLSSAR